MPVRFTSVVQWWCGGGTMVSLFHDTSLTWILHQMCGHCDREWWGRFSMRHSLPNALIDDVPVWLIGWTLVHSAVNTAYVPCPCLLQQSSTMKWHLNKSMQTRLSLDQWIETSNRTSHCVHYLCELYTRNYEKLTGHLNPVKILNLQKHLQLANILYYLFIAD